MKAKDVPVGDFFVWRYKEWENICERSEGGLFFSNGKDFISVMPIKGLNITRVDADAEVRIYPKLAHMHNDPKDEHCTCECHNLPEYRNKMCPCCYYVDGNAEWIERIGKHLAQLQQKEIRERLE